MKIRFFKLALAAVLLGGLFSCAEEEIVRVPAKMDLENADEMGLATVTLSNRAETKAVSFTADGDWYIRVPEECDWITVSPMQGTGDATVNITTTHYEEEVPRNATLAFVVDNLEQKSLLKVVQLQKFYLEPTILSDVLPKTGGEAVISVSTNGTFTCEVDAAGASWISVVSQDTDEVVINAKAIAGNAVKNTAVLTFTCVEDPALKATLNLSQKNLQVTIDAKEILADGYAAEGELAVTTLNVNSWKVESDVEWIKVEKVGDKIKFAVDANVASTDRSGYISAICADSAEDADVKSVVEVKQYAVADLVDFKFNEDGTAYDVSPRKNNIRSFTTGATMNYYEEYAAWGPSVSRAINKSLNLNENAVWLCEYTDFESKIDDGYTIEAVFSIPTEHTNAETKAFGATKSGGFAIMLGNTDAKTNTDGQKVQRDGSIEFIQHGDGNWNFGVTGVRAVPGQLYHVYGVWDCETIKCYVDGELKCTFGVKTLKHATQTPHHVAVTGNYNGESTFNGSWNGTVVVARMYDKPLTAEQIAAKTALNGKIQIVK